MARFVQGTDAQRDFYERLFAAELLIDSGVPGVCGRGEDFERVLQALEGLVTRAGGEDGVQRLAFPPLLPRHELERIGYLGNFPHLAGSVFGFDGDDRQAAELAERASAHGDWSTLQQMSDLVLTPAACYPVYPAVAKRGPLGPSGVTIDAGGAYVFRNEPSGDPARQRMFHQREIVRIGSPEDVVAWREAWRERALALMSSLGLDACSKVANDPFFGRAGRMLAINQREQSLKFEVQVDIGGAEATAVASFNYHQDFFASLYAIVLETEQEPVHTACLGFGLERITLALLWRHGLALEHWPSAVRSELALGR
ncbi:MAG: amino acid--[acyl-carrier-protein] ligase [Solirubrobacteraceae bacterium]